MSPALGVVKPFLNYFCSLGTYFRSVECSGSDFAKVWRENGERKKKKGKPSCWKLKGQISSSRAERAVPISTITHIRRRGVNVIRRLCVRVCVCVFSSWNIILTLRSMGKNWHAWMHLFKLKRHEIRFVAEKMPLLKTHFWRYGSIWYCRAFGK